MNSGILGLPGGPGTNAPPVPIKVTSIPSGTSTFVPLAQTKWLRVMLLGGGTSGNSSSGTGNIYFGGAAAVPVFYWIKKTKTSYSYAVGAGGVGTTGVAVLGSDTTFDSTYIGYAATFLGLGLAGSGSVASVHGESSPYGKGGTVAQGNATGYGAGGGGTSNGGVAAGNGSGGLIIIEEY